MLTLFTALGSIFTTGINRWGEVRQAKHEATLAKIKASANIAELQAQHIASWEQTMAEATKSSWKDEYALILLSIPAVLCFIPTAAPFVTAGFAALATAPGWYQTAFVAAIMASFGIRAVPHIGRAVSALRKGNGDAKKAEGSEAK